MTIRRLGRWLKLPVVAAGTTIVLSGCVLSVTSGPRVLANDHVTFTGNLLNSEVPAHTEYWFEYGTSAGYGSSTTHTPIDLEKGDNLVSERVDGLSSGTHYHYRLCHDVPNHDPACGKDQEATTGTGRVSLQGSGSAVVFDLAGVGLRDELDSVDATADPSGTGYVDGITAGTDYLFCHCSQPPVPEGPSGGDVVCLRVADNIATMVWTSPRFGPGFGRVLEVEDNGPSGDVSVEANTRLADGCPAPTPALFASPTGTGNYTVQGG